MDPKWMEHWVRESDNPEELENRLEDIRIMRDAASELKDETDLWLLVKSEKALEAGEERRKEIEAVERAGREFLQHLKDVSGELTEEEKNALDAQYNEALDAELKADGHRYRLQRARTEAMREAKERMDRSKCNRPDCPRHGKK